MNYLQNFFQYKKVYSASFFGKKKSRLICIKDISNLVSENFWGLFYSWQNLFIVKNAAAFRYMYIIVHISPSLRTNLWKKANQIFLLGFCEGIVGAWTNLEDDSQKLSEGAFACECEHQQKLFSLSTEKKTLTKAFLVFCRYDGE